MTLEEILPIDKESDPLLGRYVPSPAYAALIWCEPTERDDTGSVAIPLATAAVPSEFAPSENCTLPVAAAGEMEAVSETGWPEVNGPPGAVSVRVVEL